MYCTISAGSFGNDDLLQTSLIQNMSYYFLVFGAELFDRSFTLIHPLQFSSWHNISSPALREMINAFKRMDFFSVTNK
jgi:hypothetical protein